MGRRITAHAAAHLQATAVLLFDVAHHNDSCGQNETGARYRGAQNNKRHEVPVAKDKEMAARHVTCVPNNGAAVAGDTESLRGGHSKICGVEMR